MPDLEKYIKIQTPVGDVKIESESLKKFIQDCVDTSKQEDSLKYSDIYSFLGKGELGERQKRFFETYLNAPYKRGVAALESAKQRIHEGYNSKRISKRTFKHSLLYSKATANFSIDLYFRFFIYGGE